MYYRTITILIPLALCFGCDNGDLPSPPATSAVFNSAGAPTVEFDLPDMMCEDGCAQAVKDILARQSGVKEVQVDFAGKTATVAIDQATFDSQQALAALVDKGFDNSKLAGDKIVAPPSQNPPEAEPQTAATEPAAAAQ
jgi:copper chaperone CopZ